MTAYDIEPGDKVHPGDPVIVDRYSTAARINHWITAISLILLALSGLALFHPSLFFLTGYPTGFRSHAFLVLWRENTVIDSQRPQVWHGNTLVLIHNGLKVTLLLLQ